MLSQETTKGRETLETSLVNTYASLDENRLRGKFQLAVERDWQTVKADLEAVMQRRGIVFVHKDRG